MSRSRWSALVWLGWLGLFLALELPAARKLTPWTTLSEYAWDLESHDKPLRYALMFGLATLQVHIVSRWP